MCKTKLLSENLIELAKMGVPNAQYQLGGMYENGNGVEKDVEKAIEWYQKSAKQGHAGAQNSLGFIYILGELTDIDEEKAFEYFLMAASQGCMLNLK